MTTPQQVENRIKARRFNQANDGIVLFCEASGIPVNTQRIQTLFWDVWNGMRMPIAGQGHGSDQVICYNPVTHQKLQFVDIDQGIPTVLIGRFTDNIYSWQQVFGGRMPTWN